MLAEARPDLEIWKANEFICDPVKRIGATPDYYARDKDGKRVVIEIKTVTKRRFDAVLGRRAAGSLRLATRDRR